MLVEETLPTLAPFSSSTGWVRVVAGIYCDGADRAASVKQIIADRELVRAESRGAVGAKVPEVARGVSSTKACFLIPDGIQTDPYFAGLLLGQSGWSRWLHLAPDG